MTSYVFSVVRGSLNHKVKMFVSKTIFRSVLKLSHYAGFHAIGDTNYSKFAKTVINIYLTALFAMFFSQIICLSITLIFKFSKDDGSGAFCVLVIMVNNVMLIIFYTIKGDKISKNYEQMGKFVEAILKDSESGEFVEGVNKNARFINWFVHSYMSSVYVLLVMEVFIKGLTYEKVFELVAEENKWIYVFPWDANNWTFWPTLIFQMISTAVMTVVQQANHYYLMVMMILQTLCFRHLKTSLAHYLRSSKERNIKSNLSELQLLRSLYKRDNGNKCSWHLESGTEDRVKKWIQMHNQLLSLCREFVDIYSPLLITYFLVMFLILISGVFSITQNHHYYGIMEKTLLGLYFAGIIFNLFILSIAGSNLSFESVRTFEDAFHTPWYACSRQVKSTLMVVCEAAKRPVRFAAFGSHQFNLSLDTFIWVMRAMVSFYMALVQIKNRASQRLN